LPFSFCAYEPFVDVDTREVVNAQQHANGVFGGPRAQKSICDIRYDIISSSL